MYCPPGLMCVPTLPWGTKIVKFPGVYKLVLVLFLYIKLFGSLSLIL